LHLPPLSTGVAAAALLDSADPDVIYSVVGGVEVLSYRKPRRPVADATQVFTEAFPQAPSGLTDVHASATVASDAVRHILRLTGEAILDGV